MSTVACAKCDGTWDVSRMRPGQTIPMCPSHLRGMISDTSTFTVVAPWPRVLLERSLAVLGVAIGVGLYTHGWIGWAWALVTGG